MATVRELLDRWREEDASLTERERIERHLGFVVVGYAADIAGPADEDFESFLRHHTIPEYLAATLALAREQGLLDTADHADYRKRKGGSDAG